MTHQQEMALQSLLESKTKIEAAQAAGVSYSSLRRWLAEDAEFQQAYRSALDGLLQDASDESKKRLSGALGVLAEIMENTDEPAAARISASKALLEISLKLHEAADFADRLKRLERLTAESGGMT